MDFLWTGEYFICQGLIHMLQGSSEEGVLERPFP